MKPALLPAVVGLVAALVPPLVGAAEVNIDSFAASSTRVVAGSSVDFVVQYSALTQSWRYGGSNPHEPEPVDGDQYWYVNWYSSYDETLTEVSLNAHGRSFTEAVSAAPGASHRGSWSFSASFPKAGVFEITLAGSWSADVTIDEGSEEAWRSCWYDDPDNPGPLRCDAWNWSYPQYSDHYTEGGLLGPRSLTVQVTAVPEPATAMLWLAGLGLLGAAVRAARRSSAPRAD